MENRVYVNRTLNLRKISHLGFDMDHTLVRYDSAAFEKTTFEMVLERMVLKGYPKEILKFPFESELCVRGLVMDKKKGNLIKVNRHSAIRSAYHGTKPMTFLEQKQSYSTTYIDLRDTRYVSVDTAFSISSVNLFMQLVDYKDSNPAAGFSDYDSIALDLLTCVDDVHRDGSLKSVVRKNLSKYVLKDKSLVEGLERFVKHGKKLFVLTNSDFAYTKLLLDFAINPFLKVHKDWSELFTFVITSAQKPRFFYDNLKFLKVNPTDGSLWNVSEPLQPGIYQGGCASAFTKDLKLDGDDILYIGDHIYGDILRLKKDCNWRTAMVIEELENEVQAYKKVASVQEKIDALMDEKEPLELKSVELISKSVEKGADVKKEKDAKILELQEKVSQIDKKISELIRKHQAQFNKYWGEIMRTGNEESYFAYQTERFACIYMAKLSDLLQYSPRTYFRAPRRAMPHEMNA